VWYPEGPTGLLGQVYFLLTVIQMLPPSIQPYLIMYIYQESWRSVLQPSTYTRLQGLHTWTIIVLSGVMSVFIPVLGVMGWHMTTEEWFADDSFALTLLYTVYVITLLGYALQCVSMTVLWCMSFR
ncbi:hypothetical protein KIPB_011584, partial [Kipferlia bialata]